MAQSHPARLVGRDSELEHLEAALDAVDDGGPAYVTVEGEPGIGKTRLLDELRARAQARGHVVLSGAAAEFEREMPFSVWVDALDEYVASQDFARARVVGRGAGGRARPGAAVAARRRTATAARSPTSASGPTAPSAGCSAWWPSEKPLVLVLDDLHWSDGASVELIAALARRAPDAPVLMALGFRPGQVALRLTAALAGPACAPHGARSAQRGRGDPAPRAPGRATRPPPSIATAAATRSTSSSSAGWTAARWPSDRSRRARPTVPACRRRWRERSRPSWGRCRTGRRVLLNAAAVAGEPFELDLAAAIGEIEAGGGADGARRPAGRRPRPADPGAAPLRVPPPARAAARCTSRCAEAGGWPLTPRRPKRWPRAGRRPPSRRTTSSSRRAPATRTRSRCCSRQARMPPLARPGRGRALVRGRAAARSERGRRSPGVGARVARLGAARARRARALPRDAARGDRAAPARVGRPAGRADHLLRRGRALARAGTRTRTVASVAAWEELPGPLDRRRGGAADRAQHRRRCTSSTTSRRVAMGRGALETARALGDRALIARGRVGAVPERGRRWATSRTPREHREEALAHVDSALRRRARAAPGGALLPGLGRELPRALRGGDRPRGPRYRDRAVPRARGACSPR